MNARTKRASFDEADAALELTLEELDQGVPNYNEWLRSLVAPAAVGTVLEVGAGMGTFSLALLRTADKVVAVEPSTRCATALLELSETEERLQTVHGYAIDAAAFGPFDGAVMSNVLEHIDDDVATLKELAGMIRIGGQIAVLSPAFQVLMSDFDRAIGHVRRYRKKDLCARFRAAGLEIVDARYVNMPGFFAWLLIARMLRKRPTHHHLSTLYDRVVVPPVRRIENLIRPPFGQSVLVIGRVPETRVADA